MLWEVDLSEGQRGTQEMLLLYLSIPGQPNQLWRQEVLGYVHLRVMAVLSISLTTLSPSSAEVTYHDPYNNDHD